MANDRVYNFRYNEVLKYKYQNEYTSDVKTYKLSKKELEEYLQNGKLPTRIERGNN